MKPLTDRQKAQLAGLIKYTPSKPCKHGHVCDAYVSAGCVECVKVRTQRAKAKNPNRASEYNRKYRKSATFKIRDYLGYPTPTRERTEHCEMCGGQTTPGRHMALDHCHATNTFRGWLCNRCNLGLGYLGDSKVGLERAWEYLDNCERSS